MEPAPEQPPPRLKAPTQLRDGPSAVSAYKGGFHPLQTCLSVWDRAVAVDPALELHNLPIY